MTTHQPSSPSTHQAEWHVALPLDELPTDGTGKALELAGRRVAVFHHEGRVHALDDTCPHQGASLGDGVISRGDVTCPFHAWHFDLVTGKNTDSLDSCVAVFPTRIDAEGRVEVDLGR